MLKNKSDAQTETKNIVNEQSIHFPCYLNTVEPSNNYVSTKKKMQQTQKKNLLWFAIDNANAIADERTE